ncbi:MAG: hypothetical protein EBZ74_01150 [Planctomycetia bacterium]|nr:hypothetical protein [Planctomycetia bacterium]
MLSLKPALLALGPLLLAAGCAHDRAHTYAYAPPYAPPVYPQAVGAVQPVSYAAPVAGAAVVGAPVVPAGAAMPGPAGPCQQPCAEVPAAAPAGVVGGGQTPPCPPGP